ncbi:hypothetical protein A7U43_02830 [Mycobacterium adipatum]|uniref:Glycoprotein n=1 Tax=Mycobacterium adipatum TaxID=1682113 RepID=A0A172UGV5_9MYCO|nr:hypothetical protein [Mycobacterium adipatum]ANE78412.1 hypothetical protein A7U43_02830 [Mycobacterium adipatum]
MSCARVLRVLTAAVLLLLFATPAVLPRAAAGEPGATTFLTLQIDRVSPDTVTTTSGAVVTVTGTVRNIGDRPVRDVVVRLEHAPAVTGSAGLRTNLSGNLDQYTAVAPFVTLSSELQRGEQVPFTLSYPVRGAEQPSLQIDEPGVYPLLVNVNGTPDYGAPARLDDARFLLPVLGVPPDPATGDADGVSAVVPPDTSRPVGMTVLWPLADRPRLAAGIPGGTTPVRLLDDDLATSLAAGGRLDTLLSAADFATSAAVDQDGAMSGALCLAVDPDLLITVNAMTGGYVVSDDPSGGLNAPTRPGAGQEAAVTWLGRLKALAQRVCVTSTVYAQADLDALKRVGDTGLSAVATGGAADIVDQILGVRSVRGATLIGDGPLTTPAVSLLGAQGPTVAVAAAPLTAGDTEPADLAPRRNSLDVVTAPFDPGVAAALAGVGAAPITPAYLDGELRIPLQHDSRAARLQDAIGALLWRGLAPAAEPRTQIVMPPLAWDLDPDEAQRVLTSVATSIGAGLAYPRPLRAVIAETPRTAAADPAPAPEPAETARFDNGVTSGIAAVTGRLWGLTSALTVDQRTGLTGPQYTAPLREDMLRALSQTVPADARNEAAQQRLSTVSRTVADLFGAVTVVNPGGSYTLATERSPLPLALRNDLPVPIRVRLHITAPPGMTVTDPGEIELPPGFLPLRVPIEVHFTQRFAVDVNLSTVDGLALGDPVRLSVHSNAYGKVLFFITLTGGAILALLVGRRLWHRFRGEPDRADLIPPTRRPDPLDTALAHGAEPTRPADEPR